MASNKKQRSRSKSNRPKRSGARPRNYSQLYKDDHSTLTDATESAKTEAANLAEVGIPQARGSETVDWHQEYGHVLRDLRTLLIVSAALFVVMIGVGWFI